MNILEKEIEEIVFLADNELLSKKGLRLYKHKLSQVNFGDYGIADIITWRVIRDSLSRTINFQVVELKKELIDVNTLMQACRYATAIKEIMSNYNLLGTQISIEIVLIGKKIQLNGDFVFLANFVHNLEIYKYEISLEDGITFDRQYGWRKRDGFGLMNNFDSFLEQYKKEYYAKP